MRSEKPSSLMMRLSAETDQTSGSNFGGLLVIDKIQQKSGLIDASKKSKEINNLTSL